MIRTDRAHLQVAAISHPGMTGKNNEDRFAVSSFQLSQENPTPSLLAVLCDGVGGHRAGEIAADLAVETISQVVAASEGTTPVQTLQAAVQAASRRIYDQAQSNGDQNGMGSTCVCVWIIGERLYTVSVGDSRIYLQRGDEIYQLTVDHTWVQELVDRGQLTRDQARGHPHAHVIRRYLGSPVPPEGDFRLKIGFNENDALAIANQGLLLRPGDRIMLCSDGLTDLVSDPELRQVMDGKLPAGSLLRPAKATTKDNDSTNSPEERLNHSLQDLVNLANQRGGHDNITIILMQMPGKSKAAQRESIPNKKWRTALVGALGLAVFALLAVTAIFGTTLFGGMPAFLTKATPSSTMSFTGEPPANLWVSGTPTMPQPATYQPSVELTISVTQTAAIPSGATITPWPTNTYPAVKSPVAYLGH